MDNKLPLFFFGERKKFHAIFHKITRLGRDKRRFGIKPLGDHDFFNARIP